MIIHKPRSVGVTFLGLDRKQSLIDLMANPQDSGLAEMLGARVVRCRIKTPILHPLAIAVRNHIPRRTQ